MGTCAGKVLALSIEQHVLRTTPLQWMDTHPLWLSIDQLNVEF